MDTTKIPTTFYVVNRQCLSTLSKLAEPPFHMFFDLYLSPLYFRSVIFAINNNHHLLTDLSTEAITYINPHFKKLSEILQKANAILILDYGGIQKGVDIY